jgi:hypothetical protein
MKTLSRRSFLESLVAAGSLAGTPVPESASLPGLTRSESGAGDIDREALVSRHCPEIRKLNPLAPLSLGNGEFAFTCDMTGLQTFPEEYENGMPLCTMSQWGWHTSPRGADTKALRLIEYDTYGRKVGYATSSDGQSGLYNWLRENPHRLHLGQIGLRLLKATGQEARPADVTRVDQKLDLWRGILTSRFNFEDVPVTVRTAVHPVLDLLAIDIDSPLIAKQRIAVRISFPYGSPAMNAADWNRAQAHTSAILRKAAGRVDLHRRLDDDEYFVALDSAGDSTFATEKPHTFLITPGPRQRRLKVVIRFTRRASSAPMPAARETFAASAEHWKRFWTRGGAIEFVGSRDPRALELEHRVVLSQYLTAIQCSGSKPPQETGLTVNSWYGKFHLEMHWWHAAQFALWNRIHLLEKSLGWYDTVLPRARELARSQGYAGARWPKMVGPEGRDSPSPIGPLLIWQQPHPIFYAELCYRKHKTLRTLERYRSIVLESADFMASFAFLDEKTRRYVLGPPVIPAQENHPPRETWNPTFELAYWRFGLNIAQRWRERLGMQRSAAWDSILSKLSPLPVLDGVYLAHQNCPQTYVERNYDHPSMLGAFGVLTGDGVDGDTMRRTLDRVMKEWQWDKTWGWDYPLTAMTAARLGKAGVAIDALMMTTEKNRYLLNGHNWQRPNLPCYLPGNGGLLYAVAMMAAGWKGAPHTSAPGFPSDGSWVVKWEGLDASLLSGL